MSLELNKQIIKVNQAVVEDTIQTVFENDIIVPDSKPDIANILVLDGDVLVKNVDVAQDKALVSGWLNYKILYLPEDTSQGVKSINNSSDFSASLDLPHARQGMRGKVKCEIEHIDYSVINSRKIGAKAVMKMQASVSDEQNIEIVDDIQGLDNIQMLRNEADVNAFLGYGESELPIRESLEIPAGKPSITDILRNDIRISGKDYKVIDNKLIAKGELNISTLYIGDTDGSIQCIENEIPFTQAIDIDGITEDARCELDIDVADAQFSAAEDSDGELRALNADVVLKLSAASFYRQSVNLIDDAYSPKSRLSIEKKQVMVEDLLAESRTQVTVKDTVAIEDGSPEIAEVFNVLCKPGVCDYRIADDKLVVEGVIDANILYLTGSEAQPVSSLRQEIPFRHSVDMKLAEADAKCAIDLDAEHCSYSMISPTEVEVRVAVGVNAKISGHASVPVISKITEQPLDDKRAASQPSIVIYFAQPGDTLWTVAKKYYTTIDDISKTNDFEDETALYPGQQIIIPRKI